MNGFADYLKNLWGGQSSASLNTQVQPQTQQGQPQAPQTPNNFVSGLHDFLFNAGANAQKFIQSPSSYGSLVPTVPSQPYDDPLTKIEKFAVNIPLNYAKGIVGGVADPASDIGRMAVADAKGQKLPAYDTLKSGEEKLLYNAMGVKPAVNSQEAVSNAAQIFQPVVAAGGAQAMINPATTATTAIGRVAESAAKNFIPGAVYGGVSSLANNPKAPTFKDQAIQAAFDAGKAGLVSSLLGAGIQGGKEMLNYGNQAAQQAAESPEQGGTQLPKQTLSELEAAHAKATDNLNELQLADERIHGKAFVANFEEAVQNKDYGTANSIVEHANNAPEGSLEAQYAPILQSLKDHSSWGSKFSATEGGAIDFSAPVGGSSGSNPENNSVGDSGVKRGFLNTVQTSENASPDVVKAASEVQPQTYTPISNPESFAQAQARIDLNPQAAHQFVLSDAPASAEKAATGQLLMQQYAENGNFDQFKEIANSVDNEARTQGQAIQILSNWSNLSPKAVLNVANGEADKIGATLPLDFQKQIIARAADIQNMDANSPERIQATQGLLQDIANQLPPTKSELFKAFRYQNMLSSPTTLGKISYSGLFNTLVTRPADLFAEATTQGVEHLINSDYQRTVYYSDIPQWYKSAFIGIPDAWQAASEGFANNNIDRAFQDGQSGASTIDALRNANTPDYLTFFPKLHSFLYKYTQSIVAGAEQTRLMDNGVDEQTAQASANALADKLTLRSPLGNPQGEPAAVQAVDSLGNIITKSSNLPGIGWLQSWIAPFMRVSTDWTKLAVEHSPLSLPDSAYQTLQGTDGADINFAHAALGSLITGAGAYLAMQDRITLNAPTDPKQNELFYASGRKPYSVQTPAGWIPMQYFGPFGLSLFLPAAMKDAVSNQNAPKDTFSKAAAAIGNVTRMIVSTTPLPAIAGFFNFLNGDTNVNPATLASDLGSQVIPLEAMQRYIAQMIDPIYRKATSFTQRMESGIPGMTQQLPAYTTPAGVPETRNITNFAAPYAVGIPNPQFDNAYKLRQMQLNMNAIVNQASKELKAGQSVNWNQVLQQEQAVRGNAGVNPDSQAQLAGTGYYANEPMQPQMTPGMQKGSPQIQPNPGSITPIQPNQGAQAGGGGEGGVPKVSGGMSYQGGNMIPAQQGQSANYQAPSSAPAQAVSRGGTRSGVRGIRISKPSLSRGSLSGRISSRTPKFAPKEKRVAIRLVKTKPQNYFTRLPLHAQINVQHLT